MVAGPSGVLNRHKGFQNIGLPNPVFTFENAADNAPGETAPQRAVSKGMNSPPSARGSARYGARFHRFSYSSFNIPMATAMLC